MIMRKLDFIILPTLILFSYCNSNLIMPSAVADGNDSLSAIYIGIPENGIFDRWHLLGPIPVFNNNQNREDQAPQQEVFDKDYIVPSKVSQYINRDGLIIGSSSYQWQFIQSDNGIFDLTKIIGDTAYAITYAFSQIIMSVEKEFILAVGSDDAVKIWINGKLIHSNWIARGLFVDDDLIHVKLKKGRNEILVKIQNRGSSWAFACRAIQPPQYSQKINLSTQIGKLENIKQLLKAGADINAISNLGLTPLQTACLYGQKKLIDFFLEQGADTTIQMPSKEKIVDAYFNYLTKEDYPGAAVLISKDGRILYEKAYGLANLENEVPFKLDTKFRIGSTTKQFTAMSILKLQEEGLLSTNDHVSKYIPELPRGGEVTIHHLLTHTSGLQTNWNDDLFMNVPVDFKSEDIIKEIKSLKYNFNPGESWSYSNMGYIVLSMIIERVSGLSLNDFLRINFFDPLEMMNTGIPQRKDLFGYELLKNEAGGYYYENGKIYKVVSLDRSAGAGALYSTLEDLFKWNEAVFNNNIIRAADLNLAFTPVQATDGSPGKYGLNYGYGWFISELSGLKHIHHGGAIDGYECTLDRFPFNNMTIIVFLNRFPFPPAINGDIISQDIARIYLWEEMNKEHLNE